MRFTHYLEARARLGMPIPGGPYAAAAAIAAAVHRANARLPEPRRFALAFPDLGHEGEHPAGRVRILARSEKLLEKLLLDPVLDGLVSARFLRSTVEITEEGEEADIPVRCRRAEKGSLGWAERQHRRTQRKIMAKLEAGNAVTAPLSLSERYKRSAVRESDNKRECSIHLKLRSQSTGQGFSLFLRRAKKERAMSLVDTYGLVAEPELVTSSAG